MLREIFLATLPSTGRNPALSLSADETPLLLCRICRAWRNTALATSRLWASMHIVIPRPSGLQQLTGKITTWLTGSGAIPLNISLTYSRMVLAPQDISSLISPIVAVSRRWRNIQLDLTTYPGFASLASDGVPLLESIALRKSTITRTTNLKGPFMFLDPLRLCSIKCADMSYIRDVPISWGSLTHSTAFELSCSPTETCELGFKRERTAVLSRYHPRRQHVSLPRLRHLLVDRPYFFNGMALPALRSFHCHSRAQLPADGLRSIFPSTTDHLECLKVRIGGMTTAHLLASLADVPFLERLHIVGEPLLSDQWRGDPGFLMHLTLASDPAGAFLCPRLRRIELSDFK
ncbi:hypothetical protein DFH08DRAFT_1087016 [Mycena albidolilacea]|uniref:F-box domain-containing protein n=1 Tax=Mycena albidolilacea TaxID=1033008 RepID=A0AAD6ZB20_9AGAR|nr:hypothetical protein DFH08DRAFT_1087016 [Mycena albidolilacea]